MPGAEVEIPLWTSRSACLKELGRLRGCESALKVEVQGTPLHVRLDFRFTYLKV